MEFPFFEEDNRPVKLVDARVARLLAHKDNSVVVVIFFLFVSDAKSEKSLLACARCLCSSSCLSFTVVHFICFLVQKKREKKTVNDVMIIIIISSATKKRHHDGR